MSDNLLSPGFAGLPAASPKDQSAQPPMAMPAPGPSSMMQHFSGKHDAARARFDKVKEAQGQVEATREELDKLVALGDTVTMDDLVEAAAGMVAAGIPAVEVASILAEAPEGAALQGWVAEQDQKAKEREGQVKQALTGAGQQLAVSGLTHVIAHSAQAHAQRQKLMAMQPAGRA